MTNINNHVTLCPHCQTVLLHYSDMAFLYCPKCIDIGYNYDMKEVITLI